MIRSVGLLLLVAYLFFALFQTMTAEAETLSADIRQYGFAESRFEAGNHVGVSFDAVSGITVLGVKETSATEPQSFRIAPQLGIEPFSGRITWSTLSNHLNYYEWLPMVSGGVQAVVGKARVLFVARTGGAAGNIDKGHFGPEVDPAYGAGAHIDSPQVDFGTSLTRILRDYGNINLATVDLLFHIKHLLFDVGVRAEATKISQSSPQSFGGTLTPNERRVLLLFRGDLLAL